MWRRRLIYGILVVVNIYLCTIYYYQGLRFMLAFVLLLPIVSWLELLLRRFCCKAELICESSITRGDTINAGVRLINRSVLPLSRIKVSIKWQTPGNSAQKQKEWMIGLDSREEEILKLSLTGEHCGKAHLFLRSVKLYDYLGLCTVAMRLRQQADILITPQIEALDTGLLDRLLAPGLALTQGADDLEGYEIRDYRPGDSLHRVHWKLSARTENLQIREFESFHQSGSSVFLCFDGAENMDMKQWDKYLDKAFSLLYSLYYGESGLKQVNWQEHGVGESQEIATEQDIEICMLRILAYILVLHESSVRAGKAFRAGRTFEVGRVSEVGQTSRTISGTGEEIQGSLRLDIDLKLYMGEQYLYEI